MTATHGHPRAGHPDDNFSEFAEELRLLAEAVLERVEPVLRRTAADGRTQWSSCAWCPVCAAAAVVRGEHHDVVAAIADHGTAIVTVLREALAGVPVEPVIPPDLDPESPEYQAWLHDSFGHGDFDAPADPNRRAGDGSGAEFGTPTGDSTRSADPAAESGAAATDAGTAGAHPGASAALAGLIARFAAGAQGIRAERAARAESARGGATSGDATVADPGDSFGPGPGSAGRPGTASERGDQGRGRGATRAGYVPIDVTIKA
ncbi:hypothetical protein OHB26_37835 [Nocardia sp. NBC_01503]|uniref:hypothetical protein n=1 Tax=Nocardia sp. NBC_01503 TaxID=2975997 RepID=UPI002E7B7431|nr:hypothetical protein [Nocardia sp. NBC_01503]WTL32546.1 hypothetical protein OHB26_37835 [Nocardia sp. NBC_01503]